MMVTIFMLILKASLYGSIVGAVLLIVKRVLYLKISAEWQYLLWVILIAKLLVPFGPQTPFSVFNVIPQPVTAVSEWSSRPIPNHAGNNTAFADESEVKETALKPSITTEISKTLKISIYTILSYAWFLGMLVMLSWFIYANLSLRRKIKKSSFPVSLRIERNYRKCVEHAGLYTRLEVVTQNTIKSPALFGFLHPWILLPWDIEELDDKDIEYILLHEISHYKRMDNRINYLLIVIQAAHWFNPFIWFCFKQIRSDIELATDERTLRYICSEEHHDYAKALLNMAENISQRTSLRLLCVIDDTKAMERRIKMIKLANSLAPRKQLITAVSIVVMTIAGILLLTSSMTAAANDDISAQTKISAYDLEAIAAFETPYVGAASNVGGILKYMVPLSAFHDQNFISLDTNQPPYSLTVFYEHNENDDGNVNPFMSSDAENNALSLFAFIDNLDYVTFSFRDDASDGTLDESKYTPRFSYARSDFVKKYGDITGLKDDLPAFHKLLNENHFIMPERMQYNRIALGDYLEYIEYRNGTPSEIINNNDGSSIVIYRNLGETSTSLSDQPEEAIVTPGDDVIFYLAPSGSYKEVKVYEIKVTGYSEILMNLNITDGLYDEVISKLGPPAVTAISGNGTTHISYLLKGTDDQYVYFVFQDGKLISHGLQTKTLIQMAAMESALHIDYDLDTQTENLIRAKESELKDVSITFDYVDRDPVSLSLNNAYYPASAVLDLNRIISDTDIERHAFAFARAVDSTIDRIIIYDDNSNVIFPIK